MSLSIYLVLMVCALDNPGLEILVVITHLLHLMHRLLCSRQLPAKPNNTPEDTDMISSGW